MDVERAFSRLKSILSSRRSRLLVPSIEKHLTIQFNRSMRIHYLITNDYYRFLKKNQAT